jgi:hypothetical protein
LSESGYYDRLCEAFCRLTSMRRAGLFLYDGHRKLVVPAGSHGVEPELLALFYGSRRPDWKSADCLSRRAAGSRVSEES